MWRTLASNINLSSLSGANGFRLNGVADFDILGRSVSSAGDVNGDGVSDLLLGAIHADPAGASSGAGYVVFGQISGFASSVDLSALNGANGFSIEGVAPGDRAGSSVGNAGDVNGDGFDDVIIGAYFADPNGVDSGACYVVFGKAGSFSASIDLSTLNGSNGFRLEGMGPHGNFGRSVSSAGDLNGDGFGDLIVGAPGVDANGTDSGASYVVFGRASGFAASIELSTLDGASGFRLRGASSDDRSGVSVSGAGDVNGDGFDDLIRIRRWKYRCGVPAVWQGGWLFKQCQLVSVEWHQWS
jgi:hypothetical protein